MKIIQPPFYLIVIAVYFAGFLLPLPSSAITLSERSQVSVITSRSGADLYTAFGHSAIRVYDPASNMDYVFNYGTFNFRDKVKFYINFVRGKLNYYLSVSQYHRFERAYRAENRSLYEQTLDLTLQQRQEVFDFLVENHEPENKYYLYDFFFDNCASKIRDVFELVLQDSLVFTYDYVDQPTTFRHLLDPYVENRPWINFGFYLILGNPSDRIAAPRDYMFLPDYVEQAFDGAEIVTSNGRKPLVKRKRTIYEAQPAPKAGKFPVTPLLVCWALFVVIALLTIRDALQNRYCNGTDVALFGAIGFLGWLFLFFWFGTDHTVLPKNFNLLWALPTHLIIALLLVKKPHVAWLKTYFLLSGILMLLLTLTWKFNPQDYHPAFLPLILALGIRSFYLFYQHPTRHASRKPMEATAG